MEDKLILVDTSILIDFFRKTDKPNSALISLVRRGYSYCISAVTEHEIYIGVTPAQIDFWNGFLDRTTVLPFDKLTANVAVDLTRTLKQNRNLIDIADLFIAATAIANDLPCATLNRKHFERITGLRMVN